MQTIQNCDGLKKKTVFVDNKKGFKCIFSKHYFSEKESSTFDGFNIVPNI